LGRISFDRLPWTGFLWLLRRLRFGGLTNSRRVRDILRPSSRQLRRDQIGRGDEKRLEPALWIDDAFDPPFPGLIEIDAGNIRENIDSMRILSETEETAPLGEVLRSKIPEGRAERGERGVRGLCVGGVRFDEKVDVPGEAGLCVKDDRVSPDNQVSNAMGMECGQKVFVILDHPVRSPNL